ncbi:MAG: hypothetical protein M1823_002097 [Watsoniomyces obsoletus]|nr:MAG: hypothetical protein M1823_002097 [Watsoniomyces obsoletus]
MGTHISRVKSVDLDAWTDEQMKSILQWGNARANKYWEAKLAPGHVPSEAKIENFIRTKYESKRWVMDGGIPDPSTLDGDGDEDVPLGVVQEQQKLDRSTSLRASSSASHPPPPPKPAQNFDPFGDESVPAPRARTAEPATGPSIPPASAPPRAPKPADTLLGLDFLGGSSSTPAGTGIPGTAGTGGAPVAATSSRPDLKQSILSLYASAPRPAQPTPQAPAPATQPMGGPSSTSQAFGGLSDAFGGLSFSSTPSAALAPPAKSSPASPLGSLTGSKATPAAPQLTSTTLSGGGFFDTTPKSTPASSHASNLPPVTKTSAPPGSMPAMTARPAATTATLGDLFDMSDPAPMTQPVKPVTMPFQPAPPSVFNLSAPQAPPKPLPPVTSQMGGGGGQKAPLDASWSPADPWASNDAWQTGNSTSSSTKLPVMSSHAPNQPSLTATATAADDDGWGAFGETSSIPAAPSMAAPKAPEISADEDFGGWSSAAPAPPAKPSAPQTAAGGNKAAGGFGGSDDLFSNVWE